MFRFLFFAMLAASTAGASRFAQESSSNQVGQPPGNDPTANATDSPAVSGEVAGAEAAISSSDWKTAEAKLDAWLAAHPEDARALFDAGYVADAAEPTGRCRQPVPARSCRQSKVV